LSRAVNRPRVSNQDEAARSGCRADAGALMLVRMPATGAKPMNSHSRARTRSAARHVHADADQKAAGEGVILGVGLRDRAKFTVAPPDGVQLSVT